MLKKSISVLISMLLFALVASAQRWKGKTYLYADVAFHKEVDYTDSYLAMLNGGVEYIGNPRQSFACEFNVYQYIEKGYSVTGIGIRPATKHYLWRKKNFRVFVEVKGGIMYMFGEYPEGGSQFNFTFSGSPGVDFYIKDTVRFLLAARYSHMSNGNIYGENQNPTWDGIGIAIGVIKQIN